MEWEWVAPASLLLSLFLGILSFWVSVIEPRQKAKMGELAVRLEKYVRTSQRGAQLGTRLVIEAHGPHEAEDVTLASLTSDDDRDVSDVLMDAQRLLPASVLRDREQLHIEVKPLHRPPPTTAVMTWRDGTGMRRATFVLSEMHV